MRHRLRLLVLGSLSWMGCVRYLGPPPRRLAGADVRVVGCLDIGVGAPSDPVFAFDVANTCPYPVAVEFRNLVVRAWSADGTEQRTAPCDPRGELFPAQLDGHDVERVVLAYPVDTPTRRFCVDVARLNVDAPAPHPVEVCFHAYGGGTFASESAAERSP